MLFDAGQETTDGVALADVEVDETEVEDPPVDDPAVDVPELVVDDALLVEDDPDANGEAISPEM